MLARLAPPIVAAAIGAMPLIADGMAPVALPLPHLVLAEKAIHAHYSVRWDA